MGEYKLIALDMDGTLLNSRLELSAGNREAVHAAHRSGKHVVLCTGRCMAEIKETLQILPEIRYLVCENGSCVYDVAEDRILHAAPVPAQEILFILNLLRGEDAVIQAFHDNRAYFNQPNGEWAEDFSVGVYRDIFDRTAIWDPLLFERFESRPFQIEKINLYFRDAETQRRMHQILSARPLKLADSIGHMIEAVSVRADKGIGLEKLCKHLGVPMEKAIAVGDSMNDIEVLKAAGFSAAMGNACAEAKAAADYITADCDHDGVAQVIEEILMA